ncbi:MAG: hypothetical protein ABEI27_11125 [Halobellus sp.]|uniref:hypothetical protein n=1 Tax=Halobellus sp. TaxID=1979212 RepID=UPI0035D4E249
METGTADTAAETGAPTATATTTATTTAAPTTTATATTTATPTSTATPTPEGDDALLARYRFEGDLTDTTGDYDLSGSGVTYDSGSEGSQGAFWPGFASADIAAIADDEPLTFCYWIQDDGTSSTWNDDLIWKITSKNGDQVGTFCTTDGEVFLFTAGDNTMNESETDVLDGQ